MHNNGNDPPERRAWRTTQEWARLHERIAASDAVVPATRVVARRLRRIAAAAAIVVVGASVSWRMLQTPRHVPVAPIERVATTGVGERLTIRLADSSVMTIGPVSTVRYSTSAAERAVTVDGIAEFAVVHDISRPFRVHARNAVVTDVGTEFIVRAYAADSGVDVAVKTGVVAVSGGASDSVELHAGEVAFVHASGAATKAEGTSAQTLSAWIDGRLVFDGAPLSAVVAELSRWFDVQIRIPDKQLAERRVSAVYNRATVSGVLDALATTLPLRYERAGNVVTIRPAN